MRFSTDVGGSPAGDMHMAIIAHSGWHSVGRSLGRRIGLLFSWVDKAYSRGSVTLSSGGVRDEPSVDFRLLSDWRDMERLKLGFTLAARILGDPTLDGCRGTVFPASYSPRVARCRAPESRSRSRSDGGPSAGCWTWPARTALIRAIVTPGVAFERLLEDGSALADHLGATVGGIWHASGSCGMGAPADPMAVTDGSGRVFDVVAQDQDTSR